MKKLNWKQRIARAKKTGKFTDEDCRLIGSFGTCFVGEAFDYNHMIGMMSHLVDVQGINRRKANKIYELGCVSETFVQNGDIKQAQQVYNKIQKLK